MTTNEEEEWYAKVAETIGQDAMPDLRMMLTILQSVGERATPPEELGVSDNALRTFVEIASRQVVEKSMNMPDSLSRLVPNSFVMGLLIGAQIAKEKS